MVEVRADRVASWTDQDRAWLGLWTLWGYGPAGFARARAAFGAAGVVLGEGALRDGPWRERAAAVVARLGGAAPAASWEARLIERGAAELERLGAGRWVQPVHAGEGVGRALSAMSAAPPFLYGWGEAGVLEAAPVRVAALVGTRRCDERGARNARAIARGCVEEGWVVASGGALGIDTAAHEATLDAGGRGVVVLGVGLRHLYPARNARLFERIAASGGAVVTPFPLDAVPSRYHFPRRNEVLAALAAATIVIQAGVRSGAMITADYATRYGRAVLAVPGEVDSERAQGCNLLLALGAGVLADPRWVSSLLGQGPAAPSPRSAQLTLPLGEAERDAEAAVTRPLRPAYAPATGDERTLLDALGVGVARHLSELVAATGLSVAAASMALLSLELGGVIERRGGGCYARTPC